MADRNTGLYYMRARYYSPRLARFLSRDPLRSMNPVRLNPYVYALNSTLVYVDPTSLSPMMSLEDSDRLNRLNAQLQLLLDKRDDLKASLEMQAYIARITGEINVLTGEAIDIWEETEGDLVPPASSLLDDILGSPFKGNDESGYILDPGTMPPEPDDFDIFFTDKWAGGSDPLPLIWAGMQPEDEGEPFLIEIIDDAGQTPQNKYILKFSPGP